MTTKNKKKSRPHHINKSELKKLVSLLRRASLKWYARAKVVSAARVELPPLLKKDGTPGKKPQVRYKCEECGKLVKSNDYSVDHEPSVIDLDGFDSMGDSFAERVGNMVLNMFCKVEGWHVKCNDCHDKKTKEENKIRRGEDVSKVNFRKKR